MRAAVTFQPPVTIPAASANAETESMKESPRTRPMGKCKHDWAVALGRCVCLRVALALSDLKVLRLDLDEQEGSCRGRQSAAAGAKSTCRGAGASSS